MSLWITITDVSGKGISRIRNRLGNNWLWNRLGLKWYAQPTIRYDMRYDANDRICSAIYLPFLAGKQRLVITACDQKHRTQPTTAACAEMMRSGYNNGSLLGVSRCSVFLKNLLMLLKYTGCYLRSFVFISSFCMCYNCTVSYRVFLRAYRDMYCGLYRWYTGVSFQP